jgi:hypothetical protein
LCEKKEAENGKWGMINLQENISTPAIYDDIVYYTQGLYRVCISDTSNQNCKWGIIDSLGREITRHKVIDIFDSGLIVFEIDKGLNGLMNKSGKIIIEPKYDSISSINAQRIALYQGDSVIIVNDKLKTIMQLLQTPRFKFVSISKKWLKTNVNDTIVFKNLNTKRQFAIDPGTYQYTSDFIEDKKFCLVFKSHKQGLINNKGKEIIPPIYDRIEIDHKKKRIHTYIGNTLTSYNLKGKTMPLKP